MKKVILPFAVLCCIVIAISLVQSEELDKTVPLKKYSCEDDTHTSYITLKDDNVFVFNYSFLSSTIPTGEYKIVGSQIHCYDNSIYSLKYVFDIKGDTLLFNAELSSKLPGFSKVVDGSVFK